MADILEFKPKQEQRQELAWQCTCGCISFILCEGGIIECADCNSLIRGLLWFFPDGDPK